MTTLPAHQLLIALASLSPFALMRMMPDDPNQAAYFRAVIGSIQCQHVETLEETVDAFLEASHWRMVSWHGRHLITFSDVAVSRIERALRSRDLDDGRVRDCYEWLYRHFPEHPRTTGIAINRGLQSQVEGIRYMTAFHLGKHHVYSAHRSLRRVMANRELPDLTRYAAAKSLAELGEPDAARTLYEAAASDFYMPRYMAYLGFQAITSKSPSDFGEYHYSEGAMVSGGNEYRMAFDGIRIAQNRAQRHQALFEFCQWLSTNRPDIYKHLSASGF